MLSAVGDLQEGLGDHMVANLSSVETHRIRLIHGLPSGDLFTDEMEAFDRRSRNGIIVEMHENGDLKTAIEQASK